jgi:GDPmannose 4,6-dehydratase
MWLMLQQDEPEDFVVATGETHTVSEFLDFAFKCVDLDYRDYLTLDDHLYRPSEVNILLGDAAKARKHLGWTPEVSFEQLIEEMIKGDLDWYSRV